MLDVYKIEKGIPFTGNVRAAKSIAAQFQVGDSLLFPNKLEAQAMQKKCGAWACYRKNGWKFVHAEDPKGKGFRVWRIA